MIAKAILEEVLARAMSSGADFAELYAENTRTNSVYMIDGKVDSITDHTVCGVGIRAFLGVRCVSASTIDLTREGLLRCASQVADVIADNPTVLDIHLTERRFADIHPIIIVPDTAKKTTKRSSRRSSKRSSKGGESNE